MIGRKREFDIPILSFYSGGGFLDMGFEMAGFKIVWTNEVDPVFAKLHSEGITSWRKAKGNGIKAEIFNTKSILKISSAEILKEAFENKKPSTFGIIGGPPCQDFSTNGSSVGFKGSRGKLTIEFFNKILEIKPTFFVMENVTGLLKHSSHKKFLFKLLERVEEHYHFDHKILNALEFGVPQFRERVFFVGIRRSKKTNRIVKKEKWFTWPAKRIFKGALTEFKWPNQNEFGSLIKRPNGIPLKLCVKPCLVSDYLLNKIPNSNEYFNLKGRLKDLKKIKEGETNRPSFKRLHRFKFSPTACYGNNEVHLHPFKNRRISVREALRIQGVPDTYVLPSEVQLTKKFKMIGNGVPVPLSKAVAESVRKFLIKSGF